MVGYNPLYIKGMEKGLVQSRIEFILPDDAYPTLENAFIFRERIKRKQGSQLLGRLRRQITMPAADMTVAGQTANVFNFFTITGITEANAEIEAGSISITITGGNAANAATYTDNGDGTFTTTGNGNAATSSINYITGAVVVGYIVVAAAPDSSINITFNYFPSLPVMGLRSRELVSINNEETIAFDQTYAYRFINGWQEFIPGATWTGTDSDFFWSTNYWVNATNDKLFWVTNFASLDPIRYTDGTIWTDFAPVISGFGLLTEQTLFKCRAILPFRGRLLVFNTYEGLTSAGIGAAIQFPQRIRWAQIGNPLIQGSAGPPVVVGAWIDDVRGKGGFLDIPTSEDIVSVGFVRDNLVIYCERSTWQLRYTGRSIAPFQIEKVNSELGAESTFSAVQFDTSLVGIGDKGVVECDSYKSQRIDIKIPDLVYGFNNINNGTKRVHGIRDIQQRLAYWTYPQAANAGKSNIFPNRRLVYNYENDSWAIFTDSFTCFGNFQFPQGVRWLDFPGPDDENNKWRAQNVPWNARTALFPSLVAGNQQGFVMVLGGNLEGYTTNAPSLTIQNIAGNTPSITTVSSVDHNLVTGQIIQILNIPTGTPFASSLNNGIFLVNVLTKDTFTLFKYSTATEEFSIPQTDSAGTYVGGGKIAIRDNFRIVSKKFNYLDDGQNIQLGFIDVLLNDTDEGAISVRIYNDYMDNAPVNIYPQNSARDVFFNNVVPTTSPVLRGSSKNWQRVYCASRAAFITIEWTLSNAQMNGPEQESDVQIQSQILWIRRAGTQLPLGI